MSVTSIEDARGPSRKLTISTGATRHTKKAKQTKITWPMFVDRIREPVRTKERYAEYVRLPKDEQDDIKDVGWFVGGRLRDGVRKKDHLESRDLITLDIDFADHGFDFDLDEAYGEYTFACYSTHKHKPDAPRLRLVLPTSRPMTPDEYPAIARMVASWWDVEVFDDTTYQPSRVMYWPSCSRDAEYAFIDNDGELLDPDAVLGMYDDWTDAASWPVSVRQGRAIEDAAKKAADPWEKPGVVGDFCRAYTIPDAIAEFLPSVYLESETAEDRYTFAGGSTSNGAIVYNDGRFLYSNHGTDPAGGHSVNAWDLVRIHLYGDRDTEKDADKPMTKRPSYAAMAELANRDDAVAGARIDNLFDDWDEEGQPEPDAEEAAHAADAEPSLGDLARAGEFTDDDREALKNLDRTIEGDVKNHVTNVITVLRHDKRLKRCVAWNAFLMDFVQVRDLPGFPVRDRVNGDLWVDKLDSFVVAYIHRRYGFEPPKSRLIDAVNNVGTENSFHPVRSYLTGLEWDGKKRLDKVLIDRLKAEDNAYTRTVTRKTFVGAVARVMEPGVKFDTMLILEGAQGIGKSSLIRDLARGWFTDSVGSFGKDSVENMKGKWFGEIGELTQFKKAEVEHIKAFLSRQVDRIREAYARRSDDFRRQAVFIGTTNETGEYLKDDQNRRFWPVYCRATTFVDLPDEETIGQIWAEAVAAYRAGESLTVDDPEVVRQVIEQQKERQSDRDTLNDLSNWLDQDIEDEFEDDDGIPARRDTVSVQEIWEGFYNGKGRPSNADRATIRRLMRMAPGWSDETSPRSGRRVYTRLPSL